MCGKDTVLQTKQTGFRLRGLLLASQPSEAGRQAAFATVAAGAAAAAAFAIFIYYLPKRQNQYIYFYVMYAFLSVGAAAGCSAL